jgi:hypothetical protein
MKIEKVEIKYTALRDEVAALAEVLGLAGQKASPRLVYFYDVKAPDGSLLLQREGLIVRTRLDEKRLESTVKLRLDNEDPFDVDLLDEFEGAEGFKFEGDWSAGRKSSSASATNKLLDPNLMMTLAAGSLAIRPFLTPLQERLLRKFAPADADLDRLIPLGPVFAWTYPDISGRFPEESLDFESWHLPEPLSELAEVSFRCKEANAEKRQGQLSQWLDSQRLNAEGQLGPKTSKVLEFFTARG